MRSLSQIVFLAFLSVNVYAQQLSFSAQVVDSQSNLPLIGSTVISSIDTVITDYDGFFSIEVAPKNDLIIISYIGYESLSTSANLSLGDQVFSLSSSNNILETAVISASMIEQNLAESTVTLEVLKPSIIESTNSTSLDNALNLLPGVDVMDGQAIIRGGSGYSYGAGSRVLLLIDGIPALQPDAGFPNWDDIALENIAQVEVVKGASSALYGSSALNGVINVRYAQPGSEPQTKASVQYTNYGDPKDIRQKWWDSPRYNVSANLLHKH